MHRTWPLLLVALLALAGCGHGEGLVEITPKTYDFGRVQQGTLPTATFTIKNGSDRVVSIMPQANCSCFGVERGKSLRPLDPGDSMKVNVIFDTTAKPPGPVQGKYVTFSLDHPKQPSVVVPLKGEIYKSFNLNPAMVNLGRIDGRPRNFEARVVSVTPQSGYTVRLQRVAATPDVFDIETVDTPSGGIDLSLSLRQGGRPRPLGAFRADVRLELELTAPGGKVFQQRPVVKIQGSWAIKPDGSAIPR